jgi:hypothetical protein
VRSDIGLKEKLEVKMKLKAIITFMLLGYIAMMWISEMTPDMEGSVSTANITNSMTASSIDMAVWIIPVLAAVAVIVSGLRQFLSGRKGFATLDVAVLLLPVIGWAAWIVIRMVKERKSIQSKGSL